MLRNIKPNLDSKGTEIIYIGKDLIKLGLQNGEKYIIRKYKLNKFKNRMTVILKDHNVRHKFELDCFYVSV
jgi:predicted transcriptional regulator with HTH domain